MKQSQSGPGSMQLMQLFVFLQCHLLYGSDTWQELKDILDEDDLALVMCSEHRPNCLIQLMTQSLRQVLLQDSERSLLVSDTVPSTIL
jgi:predicted membrane chloride channel (bestrophin family)